MKKTFKKLVKSFKDSMKEKKEIKDIQSQAYKDEMKKQAVIMGKKQAQIEAKNREKIYRDKLRESLEKKKNNQHIDVFGLDKYNNQKEKIIDPFGLNRDRSYLG